MPFHENGYTVSKATVKVYTSSTTALHLGSEVNRKVCPEDSEWISVPKSLSTLCLQELSVTFESNNVLFKLPFINYAHILEILSTNLPLSLVAHVIPDGIYWKRRCLNRWTCVQNVYEHDGSWKRLYFERHIKEYIESLLPEKYNIEEVTQILSVCKPYVHKLSIKQMLPNERFIKCEGKCEKNCMCKMPKAEEVYEHIDLKEFLAGLQNLKELDIVFGLQHCGTMFIRPLFCITLEDCRNLGIALALSNHIQIFRLHHSWLTSELTAVLFDSLKEHTDYSSLEVIDFSFCKIGDKGAMKISQFMHCVPNLSQLILRSNKIGQTGASGLAAGLEVSKIPLHVLNLSRNPVGDEALMDITTVLVLSKHIKELDFTGCKLTITSAWMLRSFLILNTSLKRLFLSNNCFENEGGMQIFIGLCLNEFVETIDINMAGASAEIEAATKTILMQSIAGVETFVSASSEKECKTAQTSIDEKRTRRPSTAVTKENIEAESPIKTWIQP